MNKLSSSPVTFSSLFDSVAKRWLDGRPSIVTALGEESPPTTTASPIHLQSLTFHEHSIIDREFAAVELVDDKKAAALVDFQNSTTIEPVERPNTEGERQRARIDDLEKELG
ncbi:hypothetical protein LWI29_025329 [Acer saccharum]|uniref:Uncharacterized protein n=1 Tax=Acer saccharum TaxID=4024 RepID=A0AA39RRC6_ACESA|nr:hypothetical protein LWI29_025329 [Acer saccharum]